MVEILSCYGPDVMDHTKTKNSLFCSCFKQTNINLSTNKLINYNEITDIYTDEILTKILLQCNHIIDIKS